MEHDPRTGVNARDLVAVVAPIVVAACGYVPGWSTPFRSPRVLESVDGERVVVVVGHGAECERVDRVEVVEQTPERVKIEAFIEAGTGQQVCPDMAVSTRAPLTLDDPLGDRQLIGCTPRW